MSTARELVSLPPAGGGLARSGTSSLSADVGDRCSVVPILYCWGRGGEAPAIAAASTPSPRSRRDGDERTARSALPAAYPPKHAPQRLAGGAVAVGSAPFWRKCVPEDATGSCNPVANGHLARRMTAR